MQVSSDCANHGPSGTTSTFPASRARVLILSLVALAAGIATSVWLNEIRFERFPGYLQARLQTVTAGRDARIAEVLVASGALVVGGQPIVVLEDSDLEQRMQARRHEIESLEIELSR